MYLSDWHGHRRFRRGVVITSVGLLAGISGPFQTYEAFGFLPRVVFWLAVVVISWGQWLALRRFLLWLTRRNPWPTVAIGTVASFPFAALAALEFTWLQSSVIKSSGQPTAELFLWTLALMLAICWLSQLLIHFAPIAGAPYELGKSDNGQARFLKRVPKSISGELLYLKSEDHYLRVVTSAGGALILLRLKQALDELDGFDGLQVHRSYWVARAAVDRLERSARKTNLILTNDVRIPVSDTFLSSVKKSGWRET